MSKNQLLLTVKDHPRVQDLLKEKDIFELRINERREFIKKQMDTLLEDGKKYRKFFWSEVETYLRDKGLLPSDYKYPENALGIDEDMGILVMYDPEVLKKNQFQEMLKHLMDH